jgi:hypothetical protein
VLKITVVAAARRMPRGFFRLALFVRSSTPVICQHGVSVCVWRSILLSVTVNKKVRRIGDAHKRDTQIRDASPEGSVWEKENRDLEKSKLNSHPSKSGESCARVIYLSFTLSISFLPLNDFLLLIKDKVIFRIFTDKSKLCDTAQKHFFSYNYFA